MPRSSQLAARSRAIVLIVLVMHQLTHVVSQSPPVAHRALQRLPAVKARQSANVDKPAVLGSQMAHETIALPAPLQSKTATSASSYIASPPRHMQH
jgi:hypothetical protein